MVNTLQLLTHVPLFSVVLPSNALQFFMVLIEVQNFSFIPIDSVNDSILNFREEDAPHSVNFKLMGYESANSIKNMGFAFSLLLFSLAMVIVTPIMGMCQIKYCKDSRSCIRFSSFLR